MCADKFTQKESEKARKAKVRFGTGASGLCMDELGENKQQMNKFG